MARGEKFCPRCGERCGPRSWNCSKCGAGFKVKGVQHPDIDPNQRESEIKEARQDGMDRLERRRLLATIQVCDNARETEVRTRYYGKKSKTYESLDGRYRIRFGPIFMGVPIALDDNRPYKLIYNRGGDWEPVKGRSRFRKLLAAIKHMQRLQNDKGDTEEGRGRLDVRLSKMRRRKLAVA